MRITPHARSPLIWGETARLAKHSVHQWQ